MNKVLLIIYVVFFCQQSNSQKVDIGLYYGRFYSPYQYVDFGTGFRNQSASNYNFFPSLSVSKYLSKRVSVEAEVAFTLYEQYYSTRKYTLAFESSFGAG
jgi:hypothetical protein